MVLVLLFSTSGDTSLLHLTHKDLVPDSGTQQNITGLQMIALITPLLHNPLKIL
jgi:hypothetical protein